ncbi:DUF397 domain-containing protein [Plantactinospora sp. B5E13]|uniref:DUF397 domain-containing protein n=1 Tax=unclassified Plantactinospora TaxID=2631981 RepID=UPI00325C9448
MGPLDATWRVSTRTGTQGQCVETRRVDHRVEVRDSKDRDGPVITFSPTAWTNFISSATILGTNPR